jgi:threonine dehydratase
MASKFGLKSYIVMPSNSPKIKQESVKINGGEIHFSDTTMESREKVVQSII